MSGGTTPNPPTIRRSAVLAVATAVERAKATMERELGVAIESLREAAAGSVLPSEPPPDDDVAHFTVSTDPDEHRRARAFMGVGLLSDPPPGPSRDDLVKLIANELAKSLLQGLADGFDGRLPKSLTGLPDALADALIAAGLVGGPPATPPLTDEDLRYCLRAVQREINEANTPGRSLACDTRDRLAAVLAERGAT